MDKKIKILFYSDCLFYGGHETMTIKVIAALLKSEDYLISVAYYARNQHFADELSKLHESKENLRLIPLAIRSGHVQGIMSFFQWRDIIRLVRFIKNKFDIVCVAQGDIELSSKMLIAARLALIKLVSYIPGDFTPSQLGLPLAWLRNIFAYLLYKLPDSFISISNSFVRGLERKSRLSRKSIYLLENIVDDFPYYNKTDDMANLGVPKICIIGAINKRKNQQFIIDWLQEYSDFKCMVYVIGEGPLLNGISKQIAKYNLSDRFHLLGWQDNPMVLMQEMDVLVIPSLIEGVPLVMLEAAIAKLPILATNSFGMADFLPIAMRFELNNLEDFHGKLTDLLTYKNITRSLVKQNHQKAIQNNSLEKFESTVRGIFAEIAK